MVLYCILNFHSRLGDATRAAHDYCMSDQLNLSPPSYKKVWANWLKSSTDWCLSRQLWWGHQIPMWKVEHFDGSVNSNALQLRDDTGSVWVYGRDIEEATANAKGWEGYQLTRVNMPLSSVCVPTVDNMLFKTCRMKMSLTRGSPRHYCRLLILAGPSR
jgi:valyl-tRNA synthetase